MVVPNQSDTPVSEQIDILSREHGWWDRYDPEDFGKHADDAQWELVESYIIESHRFLDFARGARELREEARDADV